MAGQVVKFTDVVDAYHAASRRVLLDPLVLAEERASSETRILQWPRPYEGTQLNRLLSVLFNADVSVLLELLRLADDTESPVPPYSLTDPRFQALLRVVQRAMTIGADAIAAQYGGHEAAGRREYKNRTVEALSDWAIRSGLPRDAAFDLVGLGRRQGFRARKRAAKRKK